MLLLLLGCSSADFAMKGAYDMADTGAASAPSDGDYAADSGGGAEAPPPEEEDDYLRLSPASTSSYVFIANPDRGTVTRIGVPGLEVLTAAVGDLPSTVLATADGKYAVTLNEGSDDVSILDAESLHEERVAIRDDMNRLALSGDGKWAMAWYDPAADSLGTSDGIYSFSEVSFVELGTATHTPMAVGFSPSGVRWTEDGQRAVVISDASLAVIDLSQRPLQPEMIALADDPLDAPLAEEVELSPDGHYAFVRQRGSGDVVVVDLDTLVLSRVPVGHDPSDMDVSPDGHELAVVVRGDKQLWLLDPAAPFATPHIVDMPSNSSYGSLQYLGDDHRGVLYTTAALDDSFTLWDREDDVMTQRPLVKPIQSMAVSADGSALLVFHTLEDAAGADPASPFRGEWAITQINLEDLRSNPLLLPAEPKGYSVSDDGRYGFFIMDGLNFLESLSFSTLLHTEIQLPSLPVHVGVFPGTGTAWASQEHDLGRISFYNADDAALDTITGFELNAGIQR